MDSDVETMKTIFSEIAYALQHMPDDTMKHMLYDAPLDYADSLSRAAGLVAWLLFLRSKGRNA